MRKIVIILLMILVLVSACYADIPPDSNYVWHVAKDGNDDNGGHSYGQAKLTINAAVTAANNGDTIVIWPGTYLESGSTITSKTNLNYIGISKGSIITQDINTIPTITLAGGETFENLTLSHTGTSGASGQCKVIYGVMTDNIRIKNCQITSTDTAIMLSACNKVFIEKTGIDSSEYGVVFLAGESSYIYSIVDCRLKITNWNICAAVALSLTSGNYLIKNNIIYGNKPAPDATYYIIGIQMYPGTNKWATYNIIDNDILIESGNNSYQKAIYFAAASSKSGVALLTGNIIKTAGTTSCYDIYTSHINGEVKIVDSRYDISKIYGTMTDRSEQTYTKANSTDINTTAVLADTSAVDTDSEMRIRLYGSDTTGATAANQTSIMADVNHSVQEWYVSKSGNDNSDGHSPQMAKLTISAVVTAASNGDTIYVYPGDYDETIDLDTANKSLKIKGINCYMSRIKHNNDAKGIVLENSTILEDLTISTLYPGVSAQGVYGNAKNDITIRNCTIEGYIDGLVLNECNKVYLDNTTIYGMVDALNCGTANNFIASNCIFYTDSSGASATTSRACVGAIGGDALFVNCLMKAIRTGISSSTKRLAAVEYPGRCSLYNCNLYAYSDNVSDEGKVYGFSSYGALSDSRILLNSSNIYVESAGTGSIYSIYKANGQLDVANTSYDATKTYGTIIDRGEQTYAKANSADANVTLVLADTSAVDTTSEMRTFLTGSDTPLATTANQTTITNKVNGIDANLTIIHEDWPWVIEDINQDNFPTKQEIADTTVTTFDNNSLTKIYAKNASDDSNLYDTDAEYAAALWNAATASYGVSGSYGLLFETNIDAAISSRGTSNLIASDNIGINWGDIANPTTSVGLSGTTIGTITTYTGNTLQTGDSFAIVKSGGTGDANAIWQSTKDINIGDVNVTAPTVEEIRQEMDANSIIKTYAKNASNDTNDIMMDWPWVIVDVNHENFPTKQEIADTTVTTFDNNSLTTIYAKSAAVDANLYDTDAEYATALWNAATASYGTSGSYGLLFETNIDATVSSRGTSNLIASDNIGINWSDIANPTTAVGLSGTTIGTITNYTGNTPQTGDSFARLGAPSGASISADINQVAIKENTIISTGGEGPWTTGGEAEVDINEIADAVVKYSDANSTQLELIISTGGEGPWTTGGTAQVDVNAIVNAIDANSIILNNIATKVNDLWLTNSGGFP